MPTLNTKPRTPNSKLVYQANKFFENKHYQPFPEETAPIIIAWHLQNPENAGHLLRLAANAGCRLVLFVKSKEEVTFKSAKMKYVAGPAVRQIGWKYCLPHEVENFVPPDYLFVALETSPGSLNLYNAKLPKKMALMLGSERSGIPADVNYSNQQNIHIPMHGVIKSMNVSHAAGVCLFEWVRQHAQNI